MVRRFTVMIIPEGGDKVKRYRLSRWMFTSVIVLCSFLSILFAYLYVEYRDTKIELSELYRLRHDTVRQRQELQRLTTNLGEIQQEMVFMAETEARVRQLADLGGVSQPIPVAIGGTPATTTFSSVDAVQQQIHQLQLEIDLRRASQEDARNLLNDHVSLGRATPKGWPAKGWLTSYFGMRNLPEMGYRRNHEGIDIAARIGTPVTATADGVVARIEYSPSYGKLVVLDHGYGYRSLYAHNSRILVSTGQRVVRGDRISEVGNTGHSTGAHLHYEVRLNGVPIDPRKFL